MSLSKLVLVLTLSIYPFLLSAHAGSFAENSSEDAIYRGKAAAADGESWRSAVNLQFETEVKGSYGACTGTFIDVDVILTAAHCKIRNNSVLSVNLFKGNSTTATNLYFSGSEYVFQAHPRYRKISEYDPGSDDVAVVVLKTKRLPDGFSVANFLFAGIASAADPGQSIYAIGTGLTEKQKMSDRIYFSQGLISDYQAGDVLQVKFTNGQGICSGDSGGPVFVKNEGKLYLTAVITATSMNLNEYCGDILFANVITADRYSWIMAKAKAVRDSFAQR